MKKEQPPIDVPSIDILKGNPSEHERDAVVVALIIAAIGAAAAAAVVVAAKKEPRLLTPWRMVGDRRITNDFAGLRRFNKSRRQQRE
ncbi:MAG: hypothetical protein ABIR91_01220 [Candidatus Saccharimonadales bacterium]